MQLTARCFSLHCTVSKPLKSYGGILSFSPVVSTFNNWRVLSNDSVTITIYTCFVNKNHGDVCSNPEGLNSRRESVHWACNILMENAKLCGERRPRPHVNGCYSCISLHSIDNLNNWAFVVVRYDPMICCVLHARVRPAERHQPTPPPSP